MNDGRCGNNPLGRIKALWLLVRNQRSLLVTSAASDNTLMWVAGPALSRSPVVGSAELITRSDPNLLERRFSAGFNLRAGSLGSTQETEIIGREVPDIREDRRQAAWGHAEPLRQSSSVLIHCGGWN